MVSFGVAQIVIAAPWVLLRCETWRSHNQSVGRLTKTTQRDDSTAFLVRFNRTSAQLPTLFGSLSGGHGHVRGSGPMLNTFPSSTRKDDATVEACHLAPQSLAVRHGKRICSDAPSTDHKVLVGVNTVFPIISPEIIDPKAPQKLQGRTTK
ncbi:uncharacterized protein MELLADRAFT_101942 [Melampsora larici-populina 98AG31]|uniref:Secreted protein n=1 Tax=Melampsora larici-populina (strain 98AG31 / pathotype 3-4-7) TaxID=747676 RepID=F4R5F7_MELLP|nr:uncharacterized protein MELLADRAFT_101942 [Melampsora larici-populina 98AG31]EGG12039.1 hypothetical protein MELLADRAFT_101942 [Melampsora larici-populina 98AG31]